MTVVAREACSCHYVGRSCKSRTGAQVSVLDNVRRRHSSISTSKRIFTLRTVLPSRFVMYIFVLLVASERCHTWSWQLGSWPEPRIIDKEDSGEMAQFPAERDKELNPHFKVLLPAGDFLIVGGRNVVYNISLSSLEDEGRISWPAPEADHKLCLQKGKTKDECQNYMRVIVWKEINQSLFICGTNAFKPLCRTYELSAPKTYHKMHEEDGIAKCPFDPVHNNTALYTDNQLFSATVADISSRDALIYKQPMRTEQYDSQWLNEPNFVASFEYGDRVYFFYRETAIEYINCGKAIFSRVARVCKNDLGGLRVLKQTWTSFFKARLNCSIPGEFPFYFDEIQSTSDLGKGHYKPTPVINDQSDMIYAVFNTPPNSISGSAICAFRFEDIIKSFEGAFKEQQRPPHSNWLPVRESDIPYPHPAKTCANDSTRITDQALNFIKSRPIMDKAVPAAGGRPVLVETGSRYRLTQVAVDWQVPGADGRYYDVLFVGTSDGHVLKTINLGRNGSSLVDSVVIEDLQMFEGGSSVVRLHVSQEAGRSHGRRLIAVSSNRIRSVPLQRCHLQATCSKCVALRDPYCSWSEGKCQATNEGIQSVEKGVHPGCPLRDKYDIAATTESTTIATTTSLTTREEITCKPCVCPKATVSLLLPAVARVEDLPVVVADGEDDIKQMVNIKKNQPTGLEQPDEEIAPCSQPSDNAQYPSSSEVSPTYILWLVLVGIVPAVVAFAVGFCIGRCCQRCRASARYDVTLYGNGKRPSLGNGNIRNSLYRSPSLVATRQENTYEIPHVQRPTRSPSGTLTLEKKRSNVNYNSLPRSIGGGGANNKYPNGGAEVRLLENAKNYYL